MPELIGTRKQEEPGTSTTINVRAVLQQTMLAGAEFKKITLHLDSVNR